MTKFGGSSEATAGVKIDVHPHNPTPKDNEMNQGGRIPVRIRDFPFNQVTVSAADRPGFLYWWQVLRGSNHNAPVMAWGAFNLTYHVHGEDPPVVR